MRMQVKDLSGVMLRWFSSILQKTSPNNGGLVPDGASRDAAPALLSSRLTHKANRRGAVQDRRMGDSPTDPATLLEEVRRAAELAVHHEREGALGVASYWYLQAARLLAAGGGLGERGAQYRARGELLAARGVGAVPAGGQVEGQGELGRAHRLLEEALEADEAGRSEEALEQVSPH